MSNIQHTKYTLYILSILSVLLVASLISCQDAGVASSSSGQVCETGIVCVSDQAGLEAMADDLSKTYVLQNDITITTDSWTALGTATNTAFSGLLDGNGKVISIKAANTATGSKVGWDGLFYELSSTNEGDVLVKDLDFKIVSDLNYTSSNTGVLGKNLTKGVIENIKLYGSGGDGSNAKIYLDATTTINSLGGLIGLISTNNKVELYNISANINMEKIGANDLSKVGGLVGYVYNGKALLDSIAVGGILSTPTTGTTSEYFGGIAGQFDGTATDEATISRAVSSVDVSGAAIVGGLVGRAGNSILTNVYARGTVTGYDNVGGLIGRSILSSVNFALALGEVKGNVDFGGLIGDASNTDAVTNSYYDSDTTKQTVSVKGTAKTTADLQDAAAAIFDDFDKARVWIIKDGSYPKLYFEEPTILHIIKTNYKLIMGNVFELEFSEPIRMTATSFTLNSNAIPINDVTTTDDKNIRVTTSPSESTENTFTFNVTSKSDTSETLTSTYKFLFYTDTDGNGYYEVKSCESLQGMRNELSSKYELIQDIDCSDTENWNKNSSSVAAGFIPIGDNTNKFTGALLGNGHTISKLYINRTSVGYVGLFGYINSVAHIEALGIVDATIKGGANVGILVGANEGTLEKVYTSGTATVTGDYIGGVVGYLNSASLSFAYSTATVNGSDFVGGLVGQNYNSTISESYAAGKVTGNNFLGGLVGLKTSGSGGSSTIEKSYYDKDVSTRNDTGKGEGKSTTEMQQAATYVGWDTSVWNLVDGAYPVFK